MSYRIARPAAFHGFLTNNGGRSCKVVPVIVSKQVSLALYMNPSVFYDAIRVEICLVRRMKEMEKRNKIGMIVASLDSLLL